MIAGRPSENSIAMRLGNESPTAAQLLTEGLLLLVLEVSSIEDEATQYDYAVAVDELLTAIGADGDMLADDNERPETDDDRPLGERLNDEASNAGPRIAGVVYGLALVRTSIQEPSLREDLKNVFLSFIAKMKGEVPAVPVTPSKVPAFKAETEDDAA